MKPTPAAAMKCTQILTGKEAFSLLLSSMLERFARQEPTFSDADFDRMAADLQRRPAEWHEYRQWGDDFDVIHYFSEACRRVSMEAMWRLGEHCHLLAKALGKALDAKNDAAKKRQALENIPEPTLAERLLGDFARLHILLEAFGEIHDCNAALLVCWDRDLLYRQVTRFNRLWEMLGDEREFLDYCAGKELEDAPPVDRLSLEPADIPADLKARLKTAILKIHGEKSMWNILDAFDRPLLEA